MSKILSFCLFFFCLISFATSVFAEDLDWTDDIYDKDESPPRKIVIKDSTYYLNRYNNMVITGKGLSIGGAIIGCTGVAFMIAGHVERERDTCDPDSTFLHFPGLGKSFIGFIVLSSGGAIAIAGISILKIGERKLDNLNVFIYSNGIKLTCEF